MEALDDLLPGSDSEYEGAAAERSTQFSFTAAGQHGADGGEGVSETGTAVRLGSNTRYETGRGIDFQLTSDTNAVHMRLGRDVDENDNMEGSPGGSDDEGRQSPFGQRRCLWDLSALGIGPKGEFSDRGKDHREDLEEDVNYELDDLDADLDDKLGEFQAYDGRSSTADGPATRGLFASKSGIEEDDKVPVDADEEKASWWSAGRSHLGGHPLGTGAGRYAFNADAIEEDQDAPGASWWAAVAKRAATAAAVAEEEEDEPDAEEVEEDVRFGKNVCISQGYHDLAKGKSSPFHVKSDEIGYRNMGSLLREAPSAQTTADGGGSYPNSEAGTGAGRSVGPSPALSPRSSHGSIRSAENRVARSEEELCAKSSLVGGFEASPCPTRKAADQHGYSKVSERLASKPEASRETISPDQNSTTFPGDSASMSQCTDDISIQECPVRADGHPKAAEPLKSASVASATTAASTATLGETTSGGAGASQVRAKPFLKKGSRMPRSTLPRSDSGNNITKPITKAAPRKSLRLQPRSSSLPAVGFRSDLLDEDVPAEADGSGGAGAQSSAREACAAESGNPAAAGAASTTAGQRQRTPGLGIGGSSGSHASPVGSGSYSEMHLQGRAGNAQGYAARASQFVAAGNENFGETDALSGHGHLDGDDIYDDWADSVPWDRRGNDIDLDLDLDEVVGHARAKTGNSALAGDPPTSKVVKSYFNSAASSGLRASPDPGAGPRGGGSGPSTEPVRPRHPHWEGAEAFSTLYGRPGVTSESGRCRSPGQEAEGCELLDGAEGSAALEQEVKARSTALEQQIKKYERETELLKKLQAQAEQSERDLAREREKLWKEVESEREALHKEFDTEHAALRRERKRISQNAERHRQQIAEDREATQERKQLKERSEQLEEEMREKDKRWQRTVDRLQRQITDLTRKNQELQEEVKRAGQQVHEAQFGPTSEPSAALKSQRSNSVSSARGRRPSTGSTARAPSSGAAAPTYSSKSATRPQGSSPTNSQEPASGQTWQMHGSTPVSSGTPSRADLQEAAGLAPSERDRYGRSTPSSDDGLGSKFPTGHKAPDLGGHGGPGGAAGPGSKDSTEVKEVRNSDGRTERIFADGHREVDFANGLKKVMYPDGRTTVMFQNGDKKEIHPDGVVVYEYKATGAKQTTLTDGTELYLFADGQSERHRADGSKEIHFPNGTKKQIQANGSEEVTFADGSVRRTPVT